MDDSIWLTPECKSWSRDSDYEEYVNHLEESRPERKPVSRSMYLGLCSVFEAAMTEDFEKLEKEDNENI